MTDAIPITPGSSRDDYEKSINTPTAKTVPTQSTHKRRCCGCAPLTLAKILIFGGLLLCALSIVYGTVTPKIIDDKIDEGVVVCNADDGAKEDYVDAYGDCKDCNPYYFQMNLFNATNAEEYLQGGVKLQLQEFGPFVYRRRQIRVDVAFDDNYRVSYKQYTYHTFEPSLSCEGCTETDKFTSFDVGYLNVISQAGGEAGFLTALALGSFASSSNTSAIAPIIAESGQQMMRWVNGLNSLDPVAMKTVSENSAVLKFLATGPDAIADLDLSGFVYNGLFVTRTVRQWALGYPSLLAGLGLGSNYVSACQPAGGLSEQCASCDGEACFEIYGACKQCALGESVLAINNVTCGIITSIYAEEYGDDEAATFAESTCGTFCDSVGLCAAPLPGIAEDSGMDYSQTPPDSSTLNAYIQRTGCDDLNYIGVYEQYNGYTQTALWAPLEERRNPTLAEIVAFSNYGNCANTQLSNITCTPVQGNDATGLKPGGATWSGFADKIDQQSSDMYLSQAQQNITLYNLNQEVEYKGIKLWRFEPPEDLLTYTDRKALKGASIPVDGVQNLAMYVGFLAYVSYPMWLWGDASLTESIEVTMVDGVVASQSSMYESDGSLKSEYKDKYGTYIDIEPGTGKTMIAHKRLMASYAISKSSLNASAPMTDVLWPNLESEVIIPAYWGEESAVVKDDTVDDFKFIVSVLDSLKPVLIVGVVLGFGLFVYGFYYRRKVLRMQSMDGSII